MDTGESATAIRAGSGSDRMKLHGGLVRSTACAIAVATTGCHPTARVYHQSEIASGAPRTNVFLVADFGDERQPAADEKKTTSLPPTDASKKEPERRYTAPGVAIQQLTLLALGATSNRGTSASALAGAGKEATEATLGAGEGVLGRPGLTAPQPTVAGAVVSLPGLQQGPAGGLGFAGPANILTPQFNPLSGPMGRCGDLAAVGFFGGNHTACVQHFRR